MSELAGRIARSDKEREEEQIHKFAAEWWPNKHNRPLHVQSPNKTEALAQLY